MKSVRRDELQAGMVLGADVYSLAGQKLVPEKTTLTNYLIAKLEYYGVKYVYILEDTPAETAKPLQVIQPKIKDTPEFKEFKKNYNAGVKVFENSLNDIVEKNAEVDVDQMYQDMQYLISEGSGLNLLDMMQNLKQYDDSTFAHAMNVSLICNILAGWLGFSQEETKTATMCGLLHDIGKVKIPSNIIKKPGRLTDEEFEIIKTHTIKGYQILNDKGVSEDICNAALMHHEKCDGSGYPFGLRAAQINRYAKLVAVADVYDAMTSPRVYRGALPPFDVLQLYEDEGMYRFDAGYVMTFVQHVAETYLNARVRLSDGREGQIVYINRQNVARPTIQCNGELVDLVKNANLKIVQML